MRPAPASAPVCASCATATHEPPSPPTLAGRAGVPMEVMGLMLGEFVDEFTVRCVDVFAMPQAGTSVSVESVDPVFQQQVRATRTRLGAVTRARARGREREREREREKDREKLERESRATSAHRYRATSPAPLHADARHAQGHGAARKCGRLVPLAPGCVAARARARASRGGCSASRCAPRLVHAAGGSSRAGFGCWLSGVDCNTQQSFEQLHPRCVPRSRASRAASLLAAACARPLARPPAHARAARPLCAPRPGPAGVWRWWWTRSSRSRARWSSTPSG